MADSPMSGPADSSGAEQSRADYVALDGSLVMLRISNGIQPWYPQDADALTEAEELQARLLRAYTRQVVAVVREWLTSNAPAGAIVEDERPDNGAPFRVELLEILRRATP